MAIELHGQHELIEHKSLTITCQLILHAILRLHIIIGFTELLGPCWRLCGISVSASLIGRACVSFRFLVTFLASPQLFLAFTIFLFIHFAFIFFHFKRIIWLGYFRMAPTHINCTKVTKQIQSTKYKLAPTPLTRSVALFAGANIIRFASVSRAASSFFNVLTHQMERFVGTPISDVRTSQQSASNYRPQFEFSFYNANTMNGMCLHCSWRYRRTRTNVFQIQY